MHAEIADPKLVLLIPLTPEEERKWAYLEDHLHDPQWELRESGHDVCVDLASVGVSHLAFGHALDQVVVSLFAALDTVSQADADRHHQEMVEWGHVEGDDED